MSKVGVIGLGNMGGNMATTLAGKGFDIVGFDPSAGARDRVQAKGIRVADSLIALLDECGVIVLSLPKAEHVEAVCVGEGGVLAQGRPGSVVIDTTTSTPEVSRRVAEALLNRNIHFLDAPVSGGPAGAASGTMTMVIGGTEAAIDLAMPVLAAMSATRVHVGGVGTGNVVKIANNLLCAAHLISTAEALSLAANAGVTPAKLIEGINAGSGRSGVSQVNFPKWILNGGFDSGFTMGLMRKDVGLAQALAANLNLNLQMTTLVDRLWQASLDTLGDHEDFNRIVLRIDADLAKGE